MATDIDAKSLEGLATQLVQKEKTNWETGTHYVTESVGFNMREIIRQNRKNYWGVFDQPTDPNTGRDKIWQHLTKQFCDFCVKNIDIDTKDINFRAKNDSAIGLTTLVRQIARNELDTARFGEFLDLVIRQLAIDGTAVTYVERVNDKLRFKLVDLLNFYIDPTVDSIAEAESVIERLIVTKDEFQRLAKANSWRNSHIKGTKSVGRNEDRQITSSRSDDIEWYELYRRRGLAPESLITGVKSDKLIPTEIIVSGNDGNWTFHYAEKRPDNTDKGYEEVWYTRVRGRWYGEGVAERLIQYQLWYNTVRNIRINRAYVTQLGLWLIRKGAGVTPQMLSRLAANGVLPVTDVNMDIKQLPVQDASASSYKDDDIIYAEAQRVTGAFDSVAGDSLPASTPATNAALSAQAGQTQFTLVRDGIGMWLERLIGVRSLPLMLDAVSVGDLIRMHCDPDLLQDIDEMMVYGTVYEQLEQINQAGLPVDPNQVQMMIQQALASQQKLGKQRFVKLLHTLNVTDYDIDVQVTNEDMNVPVTVQNINQMIQVAGSLGMSDVVLSLLREEASLLGLDGTKFKLPQQQVPFNQAQSMNPQAAPGGNTTDIAGVPPQGLNEIATAAHTMEPT